MDPEPPKPVDAGTGRVCVSFDEASGAWLSIGGPHRTHGFVELTDVPPFDEIHRGDPAATRAYRRSLADGRHAVVEILVDGARPRLTAVIDEPVSPRWKGPGIRVATQLEPGAGSIEQTWSVRGARAVVVRVRGRLDRPALAEITETDPPAPTDAASVLRLGDGRAVVAAAALPARATIAIEGAPARWSADGSGLVATVDAGVGKDLRFTIVVGLEPTKPVRRGEVLPDGRTDDRLLDRALAYVRGCTALSVTADERTILTDHRLLPLSWTRDAYWQALALLAADAPGDRDRVADHLRWLWRRCDRPEDWWARSHHADGRRKDLAYQADQQLYPILEAADFWQVTDALPAGVDWSAAIDRAWTAVNEQVDPTTGLLPTGENAADDPAALPFIGAVQVLRWWAARRLEELARSGAIGLAPEGFRVDAEATRAAFRREFELGGRPWPYAVDATGRHVAYHDANDLPVAFAPAWGFCPTHDPGWRATMAFAFSAANPAWVKGPRGGLGSAHTPGPWTLGDLQALVRARLVGDGREGDRAIERLHEVAFADGMLPEAYGAADGGRVRHWFAWPGAAYAAVRLLDARGGLVPSGRSAAAWLG